MAAGEPLQYSMLVCVPAEVMQYFTRSFLSAKCIILICHRPQGFPLTCGWVIARRLFTYLSLRALTISRVSEALENHVSWGRAIYCFAFGNEFSLSIVGFVYSAISLFPLRLSLSTVLHRTGTREVGCYFLLHHKKLLITVKYRYLLKRESDIFNPQGVEQRRHTLRICI